MKYEPGQMIGSYRLLAECGSGAYGKVFLAENAMTRQRFALKVLSLSDKIAERELRGLTNYRNCRHPHLLQIHHIDKDEGHLYYTMDVADNISKDPESYIPDTLGNRLAQKESLSAGIVNKMAVELLDGLEYLHRNGLIHRDIKPDNILWINGRATLADIGLMCDISNDSLVGTPGFMSEELLSGKRNASIEDDLYALGKVIYCALTGCSVKDFPHYPGTVTITEADSLIKAYTAACQTPSPIKTTQEMKAILESGSIPAGVRRAKRSPAKPFFIACGLFMVLLAGVFSFQLRSEPQAEVEAPEPVVPEGANIVSTLELLYEGRDSGPMRNAILKAEEALDKLNSEVQEKKSALDAHKMTKDAYLVSLNTIQQAQKEHLAQDPLCRLAQAEKDIREFIRKHRGNESENIVSQFKKLLDRRDLLVKEYYNPQTFGSI